MSTLKILHEPSERNKLLVTGFVRECQKLFTGMVGAYYNIPPLVTQTILGFHYIHIVSEYNSDEDKRKPWWEYEYITNDSKYEINVEWQQQGGGDWHKCAARNCTLNGENVILKSFAFGRKSGYSQNEIIRFSLPDNDNIYRLYWIKHNKWCFDDGVGIYSNVKILRNHRLSPEAVI